MNALTMTPERWANGLTLEQFVSVMRVNQAEMRRRLQLVRLRQADRAAFAETTRPLRVLVMTEDWCGDSLMNLPILARIVEAAPGMRLRVFDRAKEPELETHYANRGITAIPVVTFLDPDLNEIGTWVERSQAAYARVAEWLAANPEIERFLHSTEGTAEERHRQLQDRFGHLIGEMERWYVEGLQQATVAEILELLAPLDRSGVRFGQAAQVEGAALPVAMSAD